MLTGVAAFRDGLCAFVADCRGRAGLERLAIFADHVDVRLERLDGAYHADRLTMLDELPTMIAKEEDPDGGSRTASRRLFAGRGDLAPLREIADADNVAFSLQDLPLEELDMAEVTARLMAHGAVANRWQVERALAGIPPDRPTIRAGSLAMLWRSARTAS